MENENNFFSTKNTIFFQQYFTKAVTSILLLFSIFMSPSCTTTSSSKLTGTPKETTQNKKNNRAVAVEDLPKGEWQAEISFPDWLGYPDDSLAMNNMYSFYAFDGHSIIYVTPSKDVKSFSLFVNNVEINTPAMKAEKTYQIDIADVTVNGINTLQVTNLKPENLHNAVKVNIPYPTLSEGLLEQAGMSEEPFKLISDIIEADISYGFPSAQLAVIKDGKLVYQNSWGNVTNNTLYDLASNTKMYATNYAIQYLISKKKIGIETKVVNIIGEKFVSNTIDIKYEKYQRVSPTTNKEWKRNLTIGDILRHQGGFPANPHYYTEFYNQEKQLWTADMNIPNILFSGNDSSKTTKEKTLEAICQTPLMYEPGTQTLYSDIDYVLLGFIIEKITGKNLDVFLKEIFWQPMNLRHIAYNPLENGFSPNDCAATELNGNTRDGAVYFSNIRTETIQGQVHDETAYYCMNGISGHAGLFANATDLATLASVMLTGGYGTSKFFSRDIIDIFTAPKHELSANWGLGWWRESENRRVWYFGTQSPSNSFGHQGWTGTLTLVDPTRNLVVAYLTNKINTPLTDKDANPNKFEGSNYTSSTLGFVTQILYQSIDNKGSPEEIHKSLTYLVADMARDKIKLIQKERNVTQNSAIFKSALALIDVVKKYTKGNKDLKNLANNLTDMLDSSLPL